MRRGRSVRTLALAGALLGAASAQAETVTVYAAGSLRGVVAALTADAVPMGIEVHAVFDGAGALRARIEARKAGDEQPDLFLSADMSSPQALASAGRSLLPPVAFARNRLCVVAQRATALSPNTLIDGLLAKSVRLKTSTPKVDPAGDYAMAMFDRIEQQRPGAGMALRTKAEQEKGTAGTAATLLLAHRIDAVVTYCSAVRDLEKTVPDVVGVAVPAEFDPHPVYGLSLLTDKPAAMRVALLLLSEKGQDAVSQSGLTPMLAP